LSQRFVIEEGAQEAEALAKFDKQMVQMKVPTILLERLKKEFEESNRQIIN
jgi:hypothetical protein